VKNMVTDPAYRDPIRTIGIIALHSPRQMRYLHTELRRRIKPDDIERFDIRVGMPPNFHGYQRSIMLLSMVYDNPAGAMVARVHQRNYNVAVSRAEDQLWVFSSIPPTATFADGDLRRPTELSAPPCACRKRHPPCSGPYQAIIDLDPFNCGRLHAWQRPLRDNGPSCCYDWHTSA
jgi:hypothetical protein